MAALGNTWDNKYAAELVATAKALAAPGKGILAADESTGTIGKRVRENNTRWLAGAVGGAWHQGWSAL